MPDHEAFIDISACRLGGILELLQFAMIEGNWLFANHMLVCLHGLDRPGNMQMVRQWVIDDIDIGMRQHTIIIGLHNAVIDRITCFCVRAAPAKRYDIMACAADGGDDLFAGYFRIAKYTEFHLSPHHHVCRAKPRVSPPLWLAFQWLRIAGQR